MTKYIGRYNWFSGNFILSFLNFWSFLSLYPRPLQESRSFSFHYIKVTDVVCNNYCFTFVYLSNLKCSYYLEQVTRLMALTANVSFTNIYYKHPYNITTCFFKLILRCSIHCSTNSVISARVSGTWRFDH